MDRHHLIGVFDDRFGQESGVCSHADNILVIIVVRDAMHVHGIGQGLALGSRRGRREL